MPFNRACIQVIVCELVIEKSFLFHITTFEVSHEYAEINVLLDCDFEYLLPFSVIFFKRRRINPSYMNYSF